MNEILYNNGNNLLLVGTDKGLKLLDVSTLAEIPNPNLPENSIDDIAISTTGKLWLSSRNGSVYRSDNVFRLSASLRFTEYGSVDLDAMPGAYIRLHRTSNNLFF